MRLAWRAGCCVSEKRLVVRLVGLAKYVLSILVQSLLALRGECVRLRCENVVGAGIFIGGKNVVLLGRFAMVAAENICAVLVCKNAKSWCG